VSALVALTLSVIVATAIWAALLTLVEARASADQMIVLGNAAIFVASVSSGIVFALASNSKAQRTLRWGLGGVLCALLIVQTVTRVPPALLLQILRSLSWNLTYAVQIATPVMCALAGPHVGAWIVRAIGAASARADA
jgi:hypothetical protein